MIHRTENDSFGPEIFHAAYPRANGRQLTLLPIWIQDDYGFIEFGDRADFVGAGAQHDARNDDARMPRNLNQMFQERAFAVGKQRFRSSHPARSAGGENDGSEQSAPLIPPRWVWRPRDSQICERDLWRRGGWR